MQARNGSEIAIIGMNCRFPGATGIEAFWNNLAEGKESITFFSEEELAEAGVDPALLQRKNYVKAASILEDIDHFDAAFFGFTPREAELLDPQQRMFLENCWEALELAGYAPEKYLGRIGVYAGVFTSSYLFNLYSNPGLVESAGELTVRHGNEKDYLATRVSYKLNLKGPSVSVQTSCSTSLVAVHLAVQNLLGGECDMALAGGVSVSIPQKTGYVYNEGDILTPDGHCRPFDVKAKGTIFGSGVGVVVLKRLDDALADGDFIHAVIKGSAINNDGADKVGFTAPSVNGQADVIADALAMADVEPRTVGLVEAHGTGTPLGDPIEMAALTRVYRSGTYGADDQQYCAIGSVKSNIGHLGAASGVAGLIKAALSLQHQAMAPSLHFEEANPNIDFAGSPFFVNTRLREWPKPEQHPRRAAVSSFGMGGTNAHVVLEEAPLAEFANEDEGGGGQELEQLLVWSAQTDEALIAAETRLRDYLDRHPNAKLADVAYTLQAGRREFPRRAALVAGSAAEALELLGGDDRRKLWRGQAGKQRRVAFVFPGQGSQYAGMTKQLYETEPVFRDMIDLCCETLQPELGFDLRELLYRAADETDAAARLQQTAVAQPALFAVEYALAQLLRSWGIEPDHMLGHSIGEYVAACLAGVFTLEDALRLVAVRGRLMQRLAPGAMLAVTLPEAELQQRLTAELSLAAVNAPELSVVAGPSADVESLRAVLKADGVETRALHTSHAFHSAMMEPILDEFAAAVTAVRRSEPQLPFLSNVTGTWIRPEEATDPQYWSRHLRSTVRFTDGVRMLLAEEDTVLVEVGPGQTLTGLVLQHRPGGSEAAIIPLTRHPKDRQSDRTVLLQAAGRLWLAGVALDWPALHPQGRRQRLPLPTYPFERLRFWIERQALQPAAAVEAAAGAGAAASAQGTAGVYAPAWTPTAALRPAEAAPPAADWLIVGDAADPAAAALAAALTARGQRAAARTGSPAEAYGEHRAAAASSAAEAGAAGAAVPAPLRLVYVAAGDAARQAEPLHALAQELQRAHAAAELTTLPQVSVVLVGAGGPLQRLGGAAPAAAAAARDWAERLPAAGFARLEVHPPVRGLDQAAERWAAELLAAAPRSDVAYRGAQRYVRTLELQPAARSAASAAEPREDGGVTVFIGAPDSFKLQLARQLSTARGHAQFAFIVDDAPEAASAAGTLLAAEAGHDAEVAAALEADGLRLHVERASGDTPEARTDRLQELELRFAGVSGVIVGPAAAATATAELRRLAPWLEKASVEFALALSDRASAASAAESPADSSSNAAVIAAAGAPLSPRRAEVELAAVTAQLATTAGVPALAARLDRREWTEREQAEAALALLARPSGDAVLAARAELAADALSAAAHPAASADVSGFAAESAAAAPPAAAPGEPLSLEAGVTAIWEELFGIKPIGLHDDFFELGGNSLLAIQLMNRIRSQYNIELQLENMFDEPTVAGLVKQVAEALAESAAEPQPDDEMEQLLRELEGQSLEDIQRELDNLKK